MNSLLFRDCLFCILFSIGYTNNATLNQLVGNESKFKKDIIRIPLVESFEELPYKTLQTLAFVNKIDANFEFIMKIDQDIIFNYYDLMNFVDSIKEDDVFIGHIHKNGLPHRNPKSKWYVPKEVFDFNAYKPFTYGGCYIIRRKIINFIIDSHHYAKFIPMEDVYVSSLVILSGFYISQYNKFYICHGYIDCVNSLVAWVGEDINKRNKYINRLDVNFAKRTQKYQNVPLLGAKIMLTNKLIENNTSFNINSTHSGYNITNKISINYKAQNNLKRINNRIKKDR